VEFGWRDETGASTGELPRALRALLGATDDADGIPVPELPGTAAEARRIAKLLDRQERIRPVLLRGSRAREARVRAVKSPFLLHFATHGFFLPDPERLHPEGLQLAGPAAQRSLRAAQQTLSNPLLRSGLLLVGSEPFLNAGLLDPDGHDGILTAEDVAGLSLPQTRLVVLSACETSLGDVHRGEGVLGLRRAFGMAGAQNVVSTLWKVDDAATQSLMAAFYGEFLDNGDVCASLTDVMRRMVHTLRARIGYAHPYYWAAFVPDGPS
jgi:CHAT domain-containing protein